MSRDLNHGFASLQPEPMSSLKSTSNTTRTTISYSIVSTMRKQVFWRNGIGLTATEAPTTPGPGEDEGFYVTIRYEFPGGLALDLREFIDELALPENSAVRKEIVQRITGINGNRQFPQSGTRDFQYTVGITRDQLEQAGGVVYLRDLDLVVGYAAHKETALHPYWQPAMVEQMREQLNFNEIGNHHRLVWIDNTHQQESMWYNNGLGVFEIAPTASPHLADGFYLFTKRDAAAQEQCKSFPLDEAIKQFMLHRTRADAEVHGKPDKAFAIISTQLEQELALMKMDLQRQKATQDAEALQLKADRDRHDQQVKDADARRQREQEEFAQEQKRQQQDWERQRDMLKMERERQEWARAGYSDSKKFEYDMDSRQRKDQSENTKHVLDMAKLAMGIISVGLSIYAVYQKSKKD